MEYCQRQIAKSGLVLEADDVRLDITRGVVLTHPRIYKIGVIGPAFFESDEIVVAVNPLFFLSGHFPVRRFILSGCQLRPEMFGSKERKTFGGEAGEGEMEFGLVIQNSSFCGVEINRLNCNIRVTGGFVWIDELEADLSGANKKRSFIRGNVAYSIKENKLFGKCKTELDPGLLIPVLEAYGAGDTAIFFRKFEFSERLPECNIQFSVSFSQSQATKGDIQFIIRNSKYSNVEIKWATGTCSIRYTDFGPEIVMNRLQLWHESGFAEVSFTNYPSMKTLKFSGKSELSPVVLLRLVGVLNEDTAIRDVNFSGETQIIAEGRVDYGNYDNTAFRAKGKVGELMVAKIRFRDLSFDMAMVGTTGIFSKLQTELCGGDIEGRASFGFNKNSPSNIWYSLDCSVVDSSFEKLLKPFVRASSSMKCHGELSGRLKVEGSFGADALQKVTGNGKVSIHNGYLFMLPLFGGLTELLAGVVPGINFVLRQTDANAAFTIRDACIKFSEVVIAGDIFSLHGRGTYSFNDELDFSVQFTIMKEHTFFGKIMQIVLYPVSKFLEFRLTGTLANPHWSGFKLPARIWRAVRSVGR
jgi:hypothetical protein